MMATGSTHMSCGGGPRRRTAFWGVVRAHVNVSQGAGRHAAMTGAGRHAGLSALRVVDDLHCEDGETVPKWQSAPDA